MSLYKTPCGIVSHEGAVPFVASVPNKRKALAAFYNIIKNMPVEESILLEADIEILRNFVLSR